MSRIDPSKAQPLVANISISATSGSRTGRMVRVEIEDAISHSRILDLDFDMGTWGRIVTGLSGLNGSGTFYGSPVNFRSETIEAVVTHPDFGWGDEKRKAAARWFKENDALTQEGWSPYVDDALNHHRSAGRDEATGNPRSRVTYHRHVPMELAELKAEQARLLARQEELHGNG